MIFENIQHISSKEEFLEKILVYIRLVEVTAERNNLTLPSDVEVSSNLVKELISIGIIVNKEDVAELQKLIKPLYQRFVCCVNFYLHNKKIFEGILDRLNNSKRKEIQSTERNADKPTFVDFFAGAGGLSCGFVQAGFKVCLANDFEDVCVRTYRFNHPELPSNKVIKGDIRNIVDYIQDYIDQDVDVVIGGPPCQGFVGI